MSKNITFQSVIEASAKLCNEYGLSNLSLKLIADELNIKTPSLYNHVAGIDELKRELMLYGWKSVENRIIESAVGFSGYDALKNMCQAFYEYAVENKGVFSAMLWYNKYENIATNNTTSKLFGLVHRILKSVKISKNNAEHIIRTLRSFLEGFALLVNNNAFGNPLKIDDSFNLSLEIIINGIKSLEGVE